MPASLVIPDNENGTLSPPHSLYPELAAGHEQMANEVVDCPFDALAFVSLAQGHSPHASLRSPCVEWLPSGNSRRTNSPKTAWEVMPYYTRCFDKGKLFVRGKKPTELAEIAKITARQWQMYQTHLNRKNPILIGFRYLKVFEQESITSYAKAAQVLGVSRIRVYQLTSLVTRLPSEITDYLLANSDDPAILRHFSERRLRPLTMLPSKKAQLSRFREMLETARS